MRFAHFAHVRARPQSPHRRSEIALGESHEPRTLATFGLPASL
jgi:hypothetical protein